MAELKPCPFCGGKADFIETDYLTSKNGDYVLLGFVRCKNRCCEQCGVLSQKEAIEAWNRRAEDGTAKD